MREQPSEQHIRQEALELLTTGPQQGWNNITVLLQTLPEDLMLSILQEATRHENPEVRSKAGDLLMHHQGGKHVELYRSLFRDPVNWVRWHTTGSASNLRGVDLDEEIRERLLTDEHISVRVAGTLYLDHVVGLPGIPFLLWLITHPTEADMHGHSADSAAETVLSFLVLRNLPEKALVYREGSPFPLGPMTCRTTRVHLQARQQGPQGNPSEKGRTEPQGSQVDQEVQGKRLFEVTVEATSKYGGFSVTLEVWMEGEQASTHTLDPATFQFWGIPDEPPPLRVEP